MTRRKKPKEETVNAPIETMKPNRNAQTNADITALLRARNTLIWIVTREECRVERAIVEAAAAAKYESIFWDCADGFTSATGDQIENKPDPNEALQFIDGESTRRVYIMRDLHRWFDPIVLRRLRSLARKLQNSPSNQARAIVVITPSAEVPPELQGHTIVLDYPLPERAEIGAILSDVLSALPPTVTQPDEPTKAQAVDAAIGMNSEEIAACYARSIVLYKRIDPAMVSTEKRRVVARERVLTWYEPDPRGLDAVGGLEFLKEWLAERRRALSPEARAYGLPAPKGCLLVGVPGTGKSLTAKAVASAWGLPLLRLDLGALRSKWVGESEANIRRALAVAETVSPCCLWLDEVEKALAGATGPQGDGGVSSDALGVVLSWMQERAGSVFVIATANQVQGLPPEFLRKGRFDELFWIDLPTAIERREILAVSIRAHRRDPDSIDLTPLVHVTQGFTGAEIAAMVSDALFTSFADNARELKTDDLMRAASSVVPLAKTSAEKIDGLRKWAVGRARPASAPEDITGFKLGRALDVS
jgi:hypothetical protein